MDERGQVGLCLSSAGCLMVKMMVWAVLDNISIAWRLWVDIFIIITSAVGVWAFRRMIDQDAHHQWDEVAYESPRGTVA